MKKRQQNSTRATALQILVSTVLVSVSAVLLASSFKAAPAPLLAPKAFGALPALAKAKPPMLLAMLNPVPKERDAYLRAVQPPAPRVVATRAKGILLAKADQSWQGQGLDDMVYRPESANAATPTFSADGNMMYLPEVTCGGPIRVEATNS